MNPHSLIELFECLDEIINNTHTRYDPMQALRYKEGKSKISTVPTKSIVALRKAYDRCKKQAPEMNHSFLPMETAPRDGTYILLIGIDSKIPVVASFNDRCWWPVDDQRCLDDEFIGWFPIPKVMEEGIIGVTCMANMVDEHETMAHHNLWKSGYNHGMREFSRTVRDLQDALREEKELRKADNERFTNLLYPEDSQETWTYNRPTQIGFYWCLRHNGIYIVNVWTCNGKLFTNEDGGAPLSDSLYYEAAWCGPIQQPKRPLLKDSN